MNEIILTNKQVAQLKKGNIITVNNTDIHPIVNSYGKRKSYMGGLGVVFNDEKADFELVAICRPCPSITGRIKIRIYNNE